MSQTYIQPKKKKKKSYPWKIMPTHPNQVKIHPTMPKATYNAKLHKSSTLSKLDISNNSTIQKCPKKSTCLHTIIFTQIIQHPRIPMRANDNKNNNAHHKVLNQARNQQINEQKQKNELTLKSLVDGYGAWLIGSWRSSSSPFHSIDGSYLFPWNLRNLGGPWGKAMEDKKDEVLKMGLKNGLLRDIKKLKDLKRFSRRCKKSSLED